MHKKGPPANFLIKKTRPHTPAHPNNVPNTTTTILVVVVPHGVVMVVLCLLQCTDLDQIREEALFDQKV